MELVVARGVAVLGVAATRAGSGRPGSLEAAVWALGVGHAVGVAAGGSGESATGIPEMVAVVVAAVVVAVAELVALAARARAAAVEATAAAAATTVAVARAAAFLAASAGTAAQAGTVKEAEV